MDLSLKIPLCTPLPSSYNPTSLLPFTGKLLKRIFCILYFQLIPSPSFLYSLQPGLLVHHTTEALLSKSRMTSHHTANLLEESDTVSLSLILEILSKHDLERSYLKAFGLTVSSAGSNFHTISEFLNIASPSYFCSNVIFLVWFSAQYF